MPNGNKPPAALRLPAEEAVDEEAGTAGAGFELTGEAHRTFKEMLGHECKVGDRYTLEVTATEVTPNSTVFSLDNVESEYEEPESAAPESPAPSKPSSSKTPAMTYA